MSPQVLLAVVTTPPAGSGSASASPGISYTTRILLADLRLADADHTVVQTFVGRDGVVLIPPFGDGWVRAVIWDRRR